VLAGKGCPMSEVALGTWNYMSSHLISVACNSFLSVNCYHFSFMIPNTLMYWPHRGTGLRISSRLKCGCCTHPFTNSRLHFLINSGIGDVSQVSLRRQKCIPGCFEWRVKWLTHVSSPVKSLVAFRNLCQGGTNAWGLCWEIMILPGISEWHGADLIT